ncbi:MAG: acyl-[acyl-carrier-protein] thioesterase [Clostridia bacterium]
MIYQEEYKIGVRGVEKNNLIRNKTILEMLEDIACYHADSIGYGILDIVKTRVSWVLLEWKVKIIKRPTYGEKLVVKTWARDIRKATIYRDYEVYNKQGELIIIGTSKWVLVNIDTSKIAKMDEKVVSAHKIEEKCAFKEREIEKIEEPTSFMQTLEYTVQKRDIDFNNHMHNIYYLDLANDALPTEVYNNGPYNNIRITYKKATKLGDKVFCKYGEIENKHIIKIIDKENKDHAIIKLWND